MLQYTNIRTRHKAVVTNEINRYFSSVNLGNSEYSIAAT